MIVLVSDCQYFLFVEKVYFCEYNRVDIYFGGIK